MTPPVEMTKGRAALPATVVGEQDPFFIALGGPKAHDSGRDDKRGGRRFRGKWRPNGSRFSSHLDGPKTHDSRGWDDKSERGRFQR
jgi:hypothetical protein